MPRTLLLCSLAASLLLPSVQAQNRLVISEIMAENDKTLVDEDGDQSDWIEIYNAGTNTVDLNGWYLADSSGRWRFPATNIAANSYLVVFASNKDKRTPGRPLHTSFRLSNDGEYLALIEPDGTTVASAFSPRYPIQVPDISFGAPTKESLVTLVSTGTAARLLIPASEQPGPVWSQPDYDDAVWTPVENGVGFENDTAPAPALTPLADSALDFSGTPGSNSWFYGYWDKKGDTDGAYNAATDFVGFPRGTGNALNPTNYWNGTKWDWPLPSNPPWTELANYGGHPSGDNGNPLLAVHWPIRRYVAETNGPLRITGVLECNATGGTCGDGTIGRIYVDGVEVYQQHVLGTSVRYDVVVEATVGSLIDFVIDPGSADNDFCDATTFTATIRPAATATVLANSFADWSDTGEQGKGNWHYGYFIRTNAGVVYGASRFTSFPSGSGPHSSANFWDGAAWRWFSGDPPYDMISQATARPNIATNGNDSAWEHWVVRRWVSEISGTISIDWHVSKLDITGGGLSCRVFHNNAQKDLVTLTGNDTTGAFRTVASFQVQAGDTIDFTIEPGADVVGDVVLFNAIIHGATTLSNQFQTDIGLAMAGKSSAYMRIPFTISNALDFSTVTLRVKADDGFVAYLNGSPVASRNAPETLQWDSTATASRPDAEAAQFEEFSVTRLRDLLRVGQNVLAIHGLNSSPTDPDFLIAAELKAGVVDVSTDSPSYFQTPTPGALNGAGSATLGPLVTQIAHTPHDPADNEDLFVTARVAPTRNPVDTVRLYYRIMFNSESNVVMLDDGQHGDGATGDGVYGATIPRTISNIGQMIRYYITATDAQTNSTRQPVYANPNFSAQYFGTVVRDPSLTNPLPVMHLFVTDANLSAANGNSAGRFPCALYYLGEFYDNVGMNRHGQSSSGGDFLRKSYDFDFNPEHHFKYAPNEDRVDDINMLTTYPDKSKMRNMLSYGIYKDSDGPSHFVVPIRVQHNGAYYADYHFVENGDSDWLKRIGRDPNGSLYKMYNMFNDATSDVLIQANVEAEKKTRKNEGNADLVALMAGVNQSSTARDTYTFDNINVPEVVNMLAARIITADIDCCHKNYYFYRDTEGTGEWEAMPWDVDLSFGRNWSSCQNYWDEKMHPENGLNTGGGNRFFDTILQPAATLEMYRRRIRTLMDELLQPPTTPTNELKFEAQMEHWLKLIGPDAALETSRWATWGNCASPSTCCTQSLAQAVEIMKLQFMNPRRTNMYSRAGTWAVLPTAQPSNAVVLVNAIEYNPTNGNQAQEYIELRNTNNYALDISGWTLKGAVDFKFIGGTVLPAGSLAYVVPDKKAFRARTAGPRGGQRLLVLGPYQGQLSARGESIMVVNKAGITNYTMSYAGAPTPAQAGLRVTEIMYHPPNPPAGSPYFEEDFEYIELRNIGTNTLNLNGVRFAAGIEFAFTGSAVTNLGPGQHVVVVKNEAAFTSRYGAGLPIAGTYIGNLNNGGEKLELVDGVGEKIQDFSYDNQWYPITDGPGASLVIINDQAHWDSWGLASSWRPSANDLGSPAQADPTPRVIAPVWVNEALTHTDLPAVDAVELYNPGTTEAAIGGWFLSDDFLTPKKYIIPTGTIIPPGGYLLLDETAFNNAALPNSFSFSSRGDEVYLFSGDGTNLTGYYHGFGYGAAETGVTFGRYTNSVGTELFVAQSTNTLGGANAYPKVGPVVISEIMYHPPDLGTADNVQDEFIELHNITSQPVALFDTTNTWRLGNAVEFSFPANQVLPPGGYALVVSFDPANTTELARFRGRYGLDTSVPIYGPYQGELNNATDTIELLKPDAPEANEVPYVLVEGVEYQDLAPWPPAADGVGPALQRVHLQQFGNDPANWDMALSPGAVFGGTPPTFTEQPANVTVIARRTVNFTALATGTAPLIYQWRWNSINIPGANSATLTLTNVQPNQAGQYSVIVFNPAGSEESLAATLIVQIPPNFTSQPQSVSVKPGISFTLRATAVSTTPSMQYQWQRNGVDITGATSNVFTVASAQFEHNGEYRLVVTDAIATETSDPARVTVLIDPTIVQQFLSQTIAAGDTLSLSVQVTNTATLPVEYRWRRNGSGFITNEVAETQNTMVWPNIVVTNSGTFNIVTANESRPGGLQGVNAFMTVVDPPKDQTAVIGAPATFTVAVGNPGTANRQARIEVQWLFNGADLLTAIPGATFSTNSVTNATVVILTNKVTIPNVQQSLLGSYAARVSVLTNVTIAPATFTATLGLPAADTDSDGMPDDWENGYVCLNKNANDASGDADSDSMSNLAEYQAGTDPCDAQSFLKVELVRIDTAGTTNVVLRFGAVSNKSYSVFYQNTLNSDGSNWVKLRDISSEPNNRTVEVTNNIPGVPARYYRLATPQQP